MSKPFSDARSVAFAVLETLSRPRPQPVQVVLDNALRQARDLDPRQYGLVSELVYGVLRHEARLDFLLGQFLRGKTPPKLRLILLMAVYALLQLDRTPAPLTVDAFVTLARQTCGASLGKVANGVLRSFLRSEWAVFDAGKLEAAASRRLADGSLADGNLTDGNLTGLAVAYAVPEWMLAVWQMGYGDARPYARAASCTPWPCVRVNAARPDAAALRDNLLASGEAVGEWGVRFAPQNQPEMLTELQREGRISRQGAGSMLLMEAILPHVHGMVWDGCAGFGGKTCTLLERGYAVNVASDIHRGRLGGLRRETARLGLPEPCVVVASADKPPVRAVDSILLDVPCSGLGTLARRPDLRRERKPEHLPELIALQARMVRAAWQVLPQEGVLVYATCALNPDENERQVARFVAETENARLVCEYAAEPDVYGSDLLYGAVLRKA